MKESTVTKILGVIVIGFLALGVWGSINDKHQYVIAQKAIALQHCKNPYYEGIRIKYIKQLYRDGTVELGFENGAKLTLTQDQILNILCR